MRYDDRLATVLRIRAASPAVARIQFQQLVDLLGTSPADARGELLDEAYVRIAELTGRIPASERAAALGMSGLRLRSPRLVASLCAAEPQVARAAIRAADLDETQWLDLIPALPAASRGVLRVRSDFSPAVRALLAHLGIGDAALPASADAPSDGPGAAGEQAGPDQARVPDSDISQTVIPLPLPAASPAPAISGIGAIVERIEAFRRARDAAGDGTVGAYDAAAGELPQLPLGEARPGLPTPLAAIDFATDAAGRISWCHHRAAPMLIGTVLAGFDQLRTPIRQRQPIRAVALSLGGAPAVAGDWQVDAVPRFESGRFTGYVGRLRRRPATIAPVRSTREADSLRQVLHELRTPVNAIQGFAEIIQHQLYGPTPHEYRAMAANIVADAARMLAGFEELERLARLQTGALRPEPGECNFAAVVAAAVARIRPQADARGFAVSLSSDAESLPVGMATDEAERLCWRLILAVTGAAQEGEHLACTLAVDGGSVRLSVPLPAALAALDPQALFTAVPPIAAVDAAPAPGGMFGTGFALRLARAEAQACGGALNTTGNALDLRLPLLTSVTVSGDSDRRSRTGEGRSEA